jgi:hypothetical protein
MTQWYYFQLCIWSNKRHWREQAKRDPLLLGAGNDVIHGIFCCWEQIKPSIIGPTGNNMPDTHAAAAYIDQIDLINAIATVTLPCSAVP